MKTIGKFSLFIALALALGCGEKRANPEEAAKAVEHTEVLLREPNDEGSLETRCFEGDLEACDELGH